MIKRKFSFIYLIIAAVLGNIITILSFREINKDKISDPDPISITGADSYKETRLQGYKFIQPLLMVVPDNESPKYSTIKENIINFIAQEQQAGSLKTASVYVREFSKGEWMAINPQETYDPGSLLKVAVLISVLKMAETDPALLSKELVYPGSKGINFPIEHFRSDTILGGHQYKVSELLEYMIINSDNRATLFLERNINVDIFKKVFTDLGMKEPNFKDPDYKLDAVKYSVLFNALFNASYLTINASEYATALLAESKFKEGLLKDLPQAVQAAHKFGEAGDQNTFELHESGIIYINKNPYLITIMTKGTNWDELSKVIGHISRMVYDKMVTEPFAG